MKPVLQGDRMVMIGEPTTHAAALLRQHGFPAMLVEQAKQPAVAMAIGLLARESNLIPGRHEIINLIMDGLWRREQPRLAA